MPFSKSSMSAVRSLAAGCRDIAGQFLLIFLGGFFGLFLAEAAGAATEAPSVRNGAMDAQEWNLAEKQFVPLDGDWEVVWGEIVKPRDFDRFYTGDLFQIPNRWNSIKNPKMEGQYGVATFRAKLNLPASDEKFSLHMISPHSAWRLYLDGEFIGGNGVLSKYSDVHTSQYVSRAFAMKTGASELVLQVGNYSHAFGGPGHSPTLWQTNALDKWLGSLSFLYSLVLGTLFAIGLFHLIFYLADQRHDEQGPVHFWFSLLCFIMVFRISGIIPYFHTHYPMSAYWSDLRFPYISLFAAPAAYLLFFRAIFPQQFPQKITLALAVINIGFAIFVLLTPESIYTHLRNFSIAMNLFVIVYSSVFVIRALIAGQRGAYIILTSNIVFLATATNDAMIYTDNGNGFDLTPFGILALGIGYSYALLLRLRLTFQEARRTSLALEQLNSELEEQVRDRTRAFKSAAAKAENSAKDRAQFIAAASHDLRQPLHALAMFNSALGNKITSEPAKNLIAKQDKAINNMSQLLQDTLDTAQAEINEKKPVWTRVNLTDLSVDLKNSYGPLAERNGKKLEIDLGSGEIITDRAMVQRVLGNLIDNALKAARRDVSLFVKQSSTCWIFRICDDGSGVLPEDIGKIFDPYFTVSKGDSSQTSGGYGLGLHVVKNFTEILGGSTEIVTSSETGTEFQINFPRAPLDPMPDELSKEYANSIRPLESMRLIVIDDELPILEAMSAMLEAWKCEVEIASDLSSTLAIIADGFLPDILIVDYHLFGTDGLYLLSELRAQIEHKIPAIVVTGATEPEILQKIQDDGYPSLSKPINPIRLNELLHDNLEKKKAML